MKRIIFVCMGNICRSPTAEAIMNFLLKNEKLENEIICDSAGTIGYHAGLRADHRMAKHASKRGYCLTSISRQFDPDFDFQRFNYIIVMDNQNLRDINSLDPGSKYKEKIFKMTDFCVNMQETEVPDPYYGGSVGFEKVLDILEDGCRGLLDRLRS